MEDLYLEVILDHYKNPRNKGWITKARNNQQLSLAQSSNSSCGDSIEIATIFEQEKVVEVRWRGEGCAISQSSMSMVSEWCIGKTKQELKMIAKEDVLVMLGLDQISSAREKCLGLCIDVLRQL